MKTPDAIITSDWHLRETTPRCRTDNFWETQWEKIKFIKRIQKEIEYDSGYPIPILHAGDIL